MYAAVTESKPNISALNTKKGYLLLYLLLVYKYKISFYECAFYNNL